MYVCMYMYMYVCMYVCTHIYMQTCICQISNISMRSCAFMLTVFVFSLAMWHIFLCMHAIASVRYPISMLLLHAAPQDSCLIRSCALLLFVLASLALCDTVAEQHACCLCFPSLFAVFTHTLRPLGLLHIVFHRLLHNSITLVSNLHKFMRTCLSMKSSPACLAESNGILRKVTREFS